MQVRWKRLQGTSTDKTLGYSLTTHTHTHTHSTSLRGLRTRELLTSTLLTLTTLITAPLRLKCDGTHAETRFRFSTKRTSPFKSASPSVQSTTGSRGVRVSGSNAGFTTFHDLCHVARYCESTGYPLHSSVSPSLPHPASPRAIIFQLDSTNFHLLLVQLVTSGVV